VTVLILRALGLGDFLTALPAIRALRDTRLPNSFVLAAPAWLAPLAIHSGAIDRLLNTRPLGPVALRRPELAVNLHGRGPQSHRRLLETEPRRLIAYQHPGVPESAGSPSWRADEHEVMRWCRLLEESGIPADPSRLDLSPEGLPPAPPAARGATLIHPGASAAARRWPARRWAAVARREAAQGRPVLVTAGPGEAALAHSVVREAGLGPESVSAGGNLLALAGLVAAAGRVVSADTGVAHLATALRRPSVVLFGPTRPSMWGPPDRPYHRVLAAPGLEEILPRHVTSAIDSLQLV
jgi:ADP-heptose:LPS heptosyltransferase